MNVLLVEDNLSIIKGLKYTLEKNNYNVEYVCTIKDFEQFLNTNKNINLIILDITLPDGSALEFYKKKNIKIPTIFLTAKDDEEIIVDALTSGAEDYITKPFSTKELLVRINKIILRTKKETNIVVKDIKLDIDNMTVYKDGKELNLTPLEVKILQLLFLNINKVVTRTFLLDKIWEWTGNYVDDHTITVYLKRIREKIGTDIIETKKGLGYKISDEK